MLSIPPTLLISALAIVPDVAACCTLDLKGAGHELILVGVTGPELGGSHLARLSGEIGAQAPPVDLALAPRLLAAVHAAIARGLVLACHDLSEGGLAVAAAEMAFAGGIGAELDVSRVPVRGAPDATRRLFAESASRFLLEVEPAQRPALHALLRELPHAIVGRTAAHAELVVTDGDRPLLREALGTLLAAWQAPLDLDHEHGDAR